MIEIDEKVVDQVLKQIKEILSKLDLKASASAKIEESQGIESILVDIKTPEANLLIGEKGNTLSAFQHLARVMLKKKLKKEINFVVDVNNYKKKKKQYLVNLAIDTASKVKSSKKKIALWPMSSYERRIIHLTLANDQEVVTESIGVEPERKVEIRLKKK